MAFRRLQASSGARMLLALASQEAKTVSPVSAADSLGAQVCRLPKQSSCGARCFATTAAADALPNVNQRNLGMAAAGLALAGTLYWSSTRSSKNSVLPDALPLTTKEPTGARAAGPSLLQLGDLELVDADGNKVGPKGLLSGYMPVSEPDSTSFVLIQFGSPSDARARATTERLVQAVRESDRNSNIQFMAPLFITLNPDKDSPAALREYLGAFATDSRKNERHGTIRGFTGRDAPQVRDAALQFQRGADPAATLFLVNPRGEWEAAYDTTRQDGRAIGEDVAAKIVGFNHQNPTWISTKAAKVRHA